MEKKEIKLSLGAVISAFIILVLLVIIGMLGIYIISNNNNNEITLGDNVEKNAKEKIQKEEEEKLEIAIVSPMEKHQIKDIMENTLIILEGTENKEFSADMLSDEELAFVGSWLAANNEDLEIDEDGVTLYVDKEVFERNIYELFGRTIRNPEDIKGITFDNGKYFFEGRGIIEIRGHIMLSADIISENTIKASFIETIIPYMGSDAITTQIIECIFTKAPESKWGLNYISYKVVETMEI
jgi:hypothetical protein